MAEILIVDDDHHLRQGFQRLLDAEGYETRTAASAEEALNLMREKMPQCVVMDVRMPGMDGLEALKRMRALEGCPPVVIMTAYSTTETAIEATRLGAFDYMLKPFDIPQVLELLQRALAAGESQRRHEAQSAEEALGEEDDIRLVGHTPPMQELYKAIGRVAPTDALVLIRGESGTGKELFAQSIHAASRRSNRPFIAVNCAAIPEHLLESEMFGYSRGAFTGSAKEGKQGLFELAHGGTLFLDEISELPYSFQGKLLRVLQEREIRRIGDTLTGTAPELIRHYIELRGIGVIDVRQLFGMRAVMPESQIDLVVTDSGITPEQRAALESAGIPFQVAE